MSTSSFRRWFALGSTDRTGVTGVSRARLIISILLLLLAQPVVGKLWTAADVFPASPSDSPSVHFTDVTKSAGIRFVHFKGNKGTSTILEETGPGVCVADYNDDGYQDFYIVNGTDRYNRGISTRNALFRNNGDGTFTDVTEQAGVPGDAYGIGCIWGDYDNDGFPDLYVMQYGANLLYHNNGNGTFTDVTKKAGVAAMEYGTSFHGAATFFDYDRDGRLDLYAGGYVNFTPTSRLSCSLGGSVVSNCPPVVYGGSPDVLYHNSGDGTFTDVTKAARISNPNGLNLAVQAGDYDNDGWPDLFVANDGIEAYLYHNKHDGTFSEVGMEAGIAFGSAGDRMAAMNISLGDYDNDGYLDLYISDCQGRPDHIWHNNHHGFFEEVSSEVGIARFTNKLSFGGGFLDYDNDGWLDLFITNGHVTPEVEQISDSIHYRQKPLLFHNDQKGHFVDVSAVSGEALQNTYTGRGVAFADFNNTGNLDIIVANVDGPPLLLRNEGNQGNHFLNLKLVGTRSNRDAMGARIRVQAGSLSQIREVMGAGSYMSQSDLRAHFGLGKATQADLVDVNWPSGVHQSFRNVVADRFYLIVEGSDLLKAQQFVPAAEALSVDSRRRKEAERSSTFLPGGRR
jgi:hypothetical protein